MQDIDSFLGTTLSKKSAWGSLPTTQRKVLVFESTGRANVFSHSGSVERSTPSVFKHSKTTSAICSVAGSGELKSLLAVFVESCRLEGENNQDDCCCGVRLAVVDEQVVPLSSPSLSLTAETFNADFLKASRNDSFKFCDSDFELQLSASGAILTECVSKADQYSPRYTVPKKQYQLRTDAAYCSRSEARASRVHA
jgi:hypothetical protein